MLKYYKEVTKMCILVDKDKNCYNKKTIIFYIFIAILSIAFVFLMYFALKSDIFNLSDDKKISADRLTKTAKINEEVEVANGVTMKIVSVEERDGLLIINAEGYNSLSENFDFTSSNFNLMYTLKNKAQNDRYTESTSMWNVTAFAQQKFTFTQTYYLPTEGGIYTLCYHNKENKNTTKYFLLDK